jgi:hypothetical protein
MAPPGVDSTASVDARHTPGARAFRSMDAHIVVTTAHLLTDVALGDFAPGNQV